MRSLSESNGVGGEVKASAEDFLVKEITEGGIVIEPNRVYSAGEIGRVAREDGDFTVFVLQKNNWNTIQALQMIAKKGKRGIRSIGYAGMKDKLSTSTQLASLFGVAPDFVSSLKLKDMSINGAWKEADAVEMGDLLGNAFEITVRGCDADEIKMKAIADELDGKMPNYFDSQRFGMRLNNPMVGLHIINGDLEEAVMEFLTSTNNENNELAREARKKLIEERDFGKALEYFPKYLRNERSVLYALSKNNNDFAAAIRVIPRGVGIMFIHAVEALIFNASLERKLGGSFDDCKVYCGLNFYGFPDISVLEPQSSKQEESLPASALVGYETKKEHLNDDDIEILEALGLKRESFKIKSMPELSMRGSYRPMLSPFKEMSYMCVNDLVKLRFSLPAGAYATILVGEFTKNQGLELKQVVPQIKGL